LLHSLSFIIALHCNKAIFDCTFYINTIYCPENTETAACGLH